MPRLHLPRSSCDFSVCDFPDNLRQRRRSLATTYALTIHTGIVRFLVLAIDVKEKYGDRTGVVRRS